MEQRKLGLAHTKYVGFTVGNRLATIQRTGVILC